MLLTIDFDEDFIDVEGVAIALVPTLQSSSVQRTKFDAPEADRFSGHSDTAFSQEIFDDPVAVTTRLRLKRWYSQTAWEMISGGNLWRL